MEDDYPNRNKRKCSYGIEEDDLGSRKRSNISEDHVDVDEISRSEQIRQLIEQQQRDAERLRQLRIFYLSQQMYMNGSYRDKLPPPSLPFSTTPPSSFRSS